MIRGRLHFTLEGGMGKSVDPNYWEYSVWGAFAPRLTVTTGLDLGLTLGVRYGKTYGGSGELNYWRHRTQYTGTQIFTGLGIEYYPGVALNWIRPWSQLGIGTSVWFVHQRYTDERDQDVISNPAAVVQEFHLVYTF